MFDLFNKPDKDISDFFSESDLNLITSAIEKAEEGTSGEIRLVIKMRCDPAYKDDLDAQALHEFAKHGLANTRDKTGVLILILMEERKFKLLADKGIYEKMSQSYLDHIARRMSSTFSSGFYMEGIFTCLRMISSQLVFHFPRKPDDTDELPNRPIIEKEEK